MNLDGFVKSHLGRQHFQVAVITGRLLLVFLSKKAHEKLCIFGWQVKPDASLLDQRAQACPRLVEALI
jgi:hypothetical protein